MPSTKAIAAHRATTRIWNAPISRRSRMSERLAMASDMFLRTKLWHQSPPNRLHADASRRFDLPRKGGGLRVISAFGRGPKGRPRSLEAAFRSLPVGLSARLCCRRDRRRRSRARNPWPRSAGRPPRPRCRGLQDGRGAPVHRRAQSRGRNDRRCGLRHRVARRLPFRAFRPAAQDRSANGRRGAGSGRCPPDACRSCSRGRRHRKRGCVSRSAMRRTTWSMPRSVNGVMRSANSFNATQSLTQVIDHTN